MKYRFFDNSQQKPTRNRPVFQSLVTAGGAQYDRRLHLQQLLPVTVDKIDDLTLQNCEWILSRLATALRQERNRGRQHHWAYSLNHHMGLLQAFRGERDNLQKLKTRKTVWPSKGGA